MDCRTETIAVRASLANAVARREHGLFLGVPARTVERAADICVLSVGLMLGAGAAAALFCRVLATGAATGLVAAVGVYALALPATFLCALLFSASFNTSWRGFFRRLDHVAIWALIAGTAAPFALAGPAEEYGLGLAITIWAVALAGISVKLRFPIGGARPSAAVFGVSGWAAMIALAPVIGSPYALHLVLLGGALYTIGIGFHLWRSLRFHRAIWHGFVIAGASAHYLAVTAVVLQGQ